MEWLSRVGDRVTSIVPRVDAIRPSPDGSLLAVFLTRASDPDLVRRERVYVIERSTGREVVALDGPDIFRAFAWVDDESLLVVRDGDGGGAAVTLHAIPDGGVEAETRLPNAGGAMSLDVTLDRRRAFMRPDWRSGPRRLPDAVLLALPSLTTLRRANPEQYRDPTAPTVASLSPEGTRVVVVTRALAYATDVDGPAMMPRSFPLRESSCIAARVTWVGRERAWVTVTTLNVYAEPGNLYALDLSRGAWTVLRTEGLDAALPKSQAVDADGRRVAGVCDPRGARAESTTLFVFDATTGEVTSSRSLDATLRAVCWARDERSLITVAALDASLEVHRWSAEGGPAERLTRIDSEGPYTEAAVTPVGDDAALITRDDSAGGAFASLVSLAP